MIASLGGETRKTKITKHLFLLHEQKGHRITDKALYDFVPYLFGPYSFTFFHEMGGLIRDGYIREDEGVYRLTEAGRTEADESDPGIWKACGEIATSYGSLAYEDLLATVYAKYPWYTVNAQDKAKRVTSAPQAECKAYTIGYEGKSLDALLDELLRMGIERLIDVRSNPVARRYGFHKSTLTSVCTKIGIEYCHFPEVGVPSEWRSELNSPQDYYNLFERYTHEVLPSEGDVLKRLAELLKQRPSAMMCKEALPECCHRTSLANYLSKQTGLQVKDLTAGDADELF